MTIEAISSSRLPSAVALLSLVVLVAIAFKLNGRRSAWPWMATILAAVGIIAVAGKNLSYYLAIGSKHAENDLAAWHQYADSLTWSFVALHVLSALLFAAAFRGVPGGSWAAVTAMACLYAGMSMQGWQHTYQASQVSLPVQYAVQMPWTHWIGLGGVVAALVFSLILLILGRGNRPAYCSTLDRGTSGDGAFWASSPE